MGKRDQRIDDYISKSEDFAKPILRHIRKLVHAAVPEVEETMKWSFPHFLHKGNAVQHGVLQEALRLRFLEGEPRVER